MSAVLWLVRWSTPSGHWLIFFSRFSRIRQRRCFFSAETPTNGWNVVLIIKVVLVTDCFCGGCGSRITCFIYYIKYILYCFLYVRYITYFFLINNLMFVGSDHVSYSHKIYLSISYIVHKLNIKHIFVG